MPSFDIVSEVNQHELTNAIDQANREIEIRFDFKGSGAKFSLKEEGIQLQAPNDFQVKQMQPVLENKLVKRGIDIACLIYKPIESSLSQALQLIEVKQGIDKEFAKKIIKLLKTSKIKVQASIQEEKIRVVGKKRDDLQAVIALLKEETLEIPLQFNNFRE